MSTSEWLEDLLRELAPRVLGTLLHRYGGFEECEDAVQEALLAAAVQWPTDGIPEKPRSWLVTVAARRLADQIRSERARRRREVGAAVLETTDTDLARPVGDESPGDQDDTLALLFLCCHPVLTRAAQVALTLRAVGGLTTAEVARAFLVPEARHHRLHAVRAHLQELAGDFAAARVNYQRAARHTTSLPEQRYLQNRADNLHHR